MTRRLRPSAKFLNPRCRPGCKHSGAGGSGVLCVTRHSYDGWTSFLHCSRQLLKGNGGEVWVSSHTILGPLKGIPNLCTHGTFLTSTFRTTTTSPSLYCGSKTSKPCGSGHLDPEGSNYPIQA